MKILVISEKANNPEHLWVYEALSRQAGVQVRVLAPSLVRDFREGFKFYPDIVWVDAEPYSLRVTKWIFLKKNFMPWSHVVASGSDNFFRQFASFPKGIEKFNLQNLSAILSNGKTTSDTLLKKGFTGRLLEISGLGAARPLSVAKTEVDAANLKGSLGLQFQVIGYAGPLRPEKGLDWLLKSVSRMPLNVSLLFIGNGPSEFALKDQAANLGMESRLKIIPDPESTFSEYHKAMDVLVLPSLSTTAWREPFNETLLEAMNVGLPIIASRSGDIPNELGEAGMLIPEGDEVALSQAIEKVLKEEPFRQELIQKGKVRLEDFNSEKIVNALADFFSTIMR
ncbi:MAG: glycosyltransferase [Candidatus Omnitrophica bacterium]|nr:glycosyltransferase [Candidatus Omnitrophota bacterium]